MLPDATLSFAAFDRLQSLLRKRDGEYQLSTSVLLKPLIRFGASREVVDAIDPALYEKFEGPSNRPDEKRRDEAMRYWLTLVAELARYDLAVPFPGPELIPFSLQDWTLAAERNPEARTDHHTPRA